MRWLRALRNWLGAERAKPLPEDDLSGAETGGTEPGDMPTTRGASWHDVFLAVRLMEKHRVEYALIGGYALAYNGLVRQTGDVDFLVRDTVENNRRWVAAMCELPLGKASELLEYGDEPFPLDDGESQAIRINDLFCVDILPTACGMSYDDLKPHIRRNTKDGFALNVLDLDGLRLTKQGMRDKDRADLRSIDMALRALNGDLEWLAERMSRRTLSVEPPAPSDGIEFRLPDEDDASDSRRMAEEVFERASRAGGEPDVDLDTLVLYADVEALAAALDAEPPVTDIRAFLRERGVNLPRPGG